MKKNVGNWMVATANSDEGLDAMFVQASEADIKKYLVKMSKEDIHTAKYENEEEVDYGVTSQKDLEKLENGYIMGCSVFSNYHVDYLAAPAPSNEDLIKKMPTSLLLDEINRRIGTD